jgi:hypothetical protein
MKRKLKEQLPMGTFVSPDVYDEMAKQTEWFIDKLCMYMAKDFNNGYHRKVTALYVTAAFAKTIMGDEEE